MRCEIMHCTRGRTTIHMSWVWHMRPQAVRTAERRWRKIRGVVVCAMPHLEGGFYVGGDSAGKRTCGVPTLWRRREDRREVRAQRQTMYLWGHRCINEKIGALFCECNLPQVLVHRLKKWQKSHDQATRQRRAAIMKQNREQAVAQDRWQPVARCLALPTTTTAAPATNVNTAASTWGAAAGGVTGALSCLCAPALLVCGLLACSRQPILLPLPWGRLLKCRG